MKTGKEGKNLIKKFEGFRAKAYLCPANVMTIGFGTTRINGNPVPKDLTITVDEADAFLEADLKMFEDAVNTFVKVSITQNQFDALVSFVYNVGVGNFKNSTLLKMLNSLDFKGAADQFLRWNKAAGKVLKGLETRRAAERELFNKKNG